MGDGTSDAPVEISCPYCGETSEVHVDPMGGAEQSYVEDCQVCCRPMEIRVRIQHGIPQVEVGTEDDPGF
ncbi:MAG: CPXCG motif-containing cysteine-rich protein [Gemmatimonadota bacterium]